MNQIKSLCAASLIMMVTGVVFAAPTVNNGTAVVDGSYGEWDLSADFFAHMYEAGDPTQANLSDLFLRYDCSTETLYSLILRTDSYVAEQSTDDAWIKIYSLGSSPIVSGASGNDGTPPDFAWVWNNTTLVGYEASAFVAKGTYAEFEAHINIVDDQTSSTGKKKQSYTAITLECGTPTVPAPGALLLGTLGTGVVGFLRRRKNL